MKYLNRSFTLSVSESLLSQRKWDYAVLSKQEFLQKYGDDAQEYVTARSCNLHDDCNNADKFRLEKYGKKAYHCHAEDCEDCFGC
jgi:hypothetical protein